MYDHKIISWNHVYWLGPQLLSGSYCPNRLVNSFIFPLVKFQDFTSQQEDDRDGEELENEEQEGDARDPTRERLDEPDESERAAEVMLIPRVLVPTFKWHDHIDLIVIHPGIRSTASHL